MITTSRTVTVGNKESIIDTPIILYRGDRDVDVEFTINGNKYMFSHGGNVIYSTKASYGQLVINTPTGENMFSKIKECKDGKVIFTITKEMIDELVEVGFYSFQIRLFDATQIARVTLPPVYQGIDIRNPIAAEDETNVVGIGLVDYAIVQKDEYENLATFLPDGSYNKTNWDSRSLITEAKLDKIEDALYTINENMEASDLSIFNRIESINQNVNRQITEFTDEADAEIEAFERSVNTNVEQFKIDTNAAMTAHKNEVSEELEGFSTQLADNENKLNDMLVHTSDFEDFIIDDDYSIAINKAIEAIKVTGGKVFISKREVEIKSTIVVPSKVTLCGIGSGETPVLSKTTIFKNFDGLAIKVVGRNVTLEDFLLTNKQGNSDSCDGILIGEGSEFNASRARINNVIVNGMGRNGIVLQYCNGAEINAKVYYNKNDGLSIMTGETVDVSGGNFRIDAYGNENNGITLNNTSGNTLSILTQSNKANGLQCSGWGNIIQGYSEYNSLNGALIEGNASGNMVNLVSFGENPITYNKGALKSNNFIFIQNGDFTKGGYFRTTRMGLDSVYEILDEVDSKVDGDIIHTKSSLESLGQGLYKYDGQYGWLRLDGVTFRSRPGTGRKGLLIHDTSDNVLKYHNGENWLTTANNFFIEYITELPEATVSQRGRIVRMHGSGNDPDIIYICIRENSTYIWKKVNLI